MTDEGPDTVAIERVKGAQGYIDVSIDEDDENIIVGVVKQVGTPYVEVELASPEDVDKLIGVLQRAKEKLEKAQQA